MLMLSGISIEVVYRMWIARNTLDIIICLKFLAWRYFLIRRIGGQEHIPSPWYVGLVVVSHAGRCGGRGVGRPPDTEGLSRHPRPGVTAHRPPQRHPMSHNSADLIRTGQIGRGERPCRRAGGTVIGWLQKYQSACRSGIILTQGVWAVWGWRV